MIYSVKTDPGLVRPNNEDSACIVENKSGDLFLMVLDGMGGHCRGDAASHLAMEIISEKMLNTDKFLSYSSMKATLLKTIKKANKEVNLLGSSKLEYLDMGTTLCLVAIRKDKTLLCNVGDSRCYILINGQLCQVSEDQTYVQFLYKTGKIKKEEMDTHPKRHVLMNALGTYPSLSVATTEITNAYDAILLCSDGLYNMLSDQEIEDVLNIETLSTSDKIDLLISRANKKGGKDNIAIVLMEDR
ncbi:MAG: protein phosphatase 2C domain-containing protein [Bacilli bacterium]|nr:protein phosphatase 2C domain-containing protein [Erysipelotrichaceae bacterium]MDD6250385.1 protein phosphatase 2C domain-containing protein [Bacillales bacterium]MDY2746661.1 protein phosphatase 2C domain-containing protein [Bacilli bacterium]MDD7382347.1 protein phosphatase 2C domain-containing protein [Bacillales bacterium]MDY3889595.1 protein phosphatase 2C domain-containing protein [Bacilli bacterium]